MDLFERDEPYTVALQPHTSENVPHVVALCEVSTDDVHALTVGKLAHRPH